MSRKLTLFFVCSYVNSLCWKYQKNSTQKNHTLCKNDCRWKKIVTVMELMIFQSIEKCTVQNRRVIWIEFDSTRHHCTKKCINNVLSVSHQCIWIFNSEHFIIRKEIYRLIQEEKSNASKISNGEKTENFLAVFSVLSLASFMRMSWLWFVFNRAAWKLDTFEQ